MTRRSIIILIGLVGIILVGLIWRTRGEARHPLIVYAAAATRVPMEEIAREYEAETGRKVELRFGASEDILTKAGMANPAAPADLFLPADETYVRSAAERGLVGEQFPLASMRAVVLSAPNNPRRIAAWTDLLGNGVKVAVPNPAAAAGKIARDHLAATGRWATLEPHAIDTGTVTEAANAAKLGSVDAAIVWDAVAAGYTGQEALALPELAGATAKVVLATLKQSSDPVTAQHFARYTSNPEQGLKHFRAAGFRPPAPESP